MKRFLAHYFNFVDDLRRAASNLEDAGFGGKAGDLLFYADTLERYKPEQRYLCDASRNSTSGLKVWQKNTLRIAEQYDRCVFNQQEIEDLVRRLNEYAHTQKNCTEDVRGPKWEDWEKYRLRPTISIGYLCAIAFTPIKGDYEY